MDRASDSRFRGRRFESRRRQILFLFIEKFTEYLQTFIYILARLSVWVILSSQVNACISEFDLLLSTYSKWLYNDQFRPYLVYMYVAHFHNSFSKFDHIDSYKVYSTCIPTDIESRLLRRPYSHISNAFICCVKHPPISFWVFKVTCAVFIGLSCMPCDLHVFVVFLIP